MDEILRIEVQDELLPDGMRNDIVAFKSCYPNNAFVGLGEEPGNPDSADLTIANARAVHGDGLWVFRELVPADSLTAVHVYFPDPWWKARHHKRRVLNEAFLKDVVRTLEPEGRLHFWTDVQAYYDATLELIAEKTPLVGPLEVPETPSEHDLDYRTHFERRTRLNEQPVYRAEFVKRSASGSHLSGTPTAPTSRTMLTR